MLDNFAGMGVIPDQPQRWVDGRWVDCSRDEFADAFKAALFAADSRENDKNGEPFRPTDMTDFGSLWVRLGALALEYAFLLELLRARHAKLRHVRRDREINRRRVRRLRRRDSVRGETSVGAGHSRGTRRAQTRARRRARRASRRQTRRHGANTSRAPNEKRRRQQSRARRTTRRRRRRRGNPRPQRRPRLSLLFLRYCWRSATAERCGGCFATRIPSPPRRRCSRATGSPSPRPPPRRPRQRPRKIRKIRIVVLDTHRRRFGRLRRRRWRPRWRDDARRRGESGCSPPSRGRTPEVVANGGVSRGGGAGGVGVGVGGRARGRGWPRVRARARADEAHPRGEPIAGLESLFG